LMEEAEMERDAVMNPFPSAFFYIEGR